MQDGARGYAIEAFRAAIRARGWETAWVAGLLGYPSRYLRAILDEEEPVTEEFVERAAQVLEVPETLFVQEAGLGSV